LRALLALLDADLAGPHWAGPAALPAARGAARAAAELLRRELGLGSPPAAVAAGLDRLGLWWSTVGAELGTAAAAFDRAVAAARAGAAGAVPSLAVLHAGVASRGRVCH
jgi:hypothetical protein